jgi:hypothetical protein
MYPFVQRGDIITKSDNKNMFTCTWFCLHVHVYMHDFEQNIELQFVLYLYEVSLVNSMILIDILHTVYIVNGIIGKYTCNRQKMQLR